MADLDRFDGFVETDRGVFEENAGIRVKKIMVTDSRNRENLEKVLSKHNFFYRFKHEMRSSSLVKR